jgi:hypothetical protein
MVKGGVERNFMCLAITITAKNVSSGMNYEELPLPVLLLMPHFAVRL